MERSRLEASVLVLGLVVTIQLVTRMSYHYDVYAESVIYAAFTVFWV